MPALSLPLIGFAAGVLFAWAAAEELSQRQAPLHSTSVWIVALYSLLVHSPAAGFLLTAYPDWSTCYLLDPELFYPAIVPAMLLINLVLPVAGFLWAAAAASQLATLKVLRLGGVAVALFCVATLVSIRRLVVEASYHEFHHDFGVQSVAGSALGYSLLYLVVLIGAAATWTYLNLKRLGRKASSGARRTGWIR